jgi:L-lactate dehydrogenase complex protein LldG
MERSSRQQDAREQILGRVRAALAKTAPRRDSTASGPLFAPVLSPMERFLSECAANFMETVLTADSAGTAAALRQVLASLPAGEIFVQDAPELRSLFASSSLPLNEPAGQAGATVRWSSAGAPAESSQASVSLCEALVALTGSVLVSSGCGGRGASVVAPCHIVVAHASQLVPDLEAALARARQIAFDHSYVGLITGSSRTADIEKKLIIGAHGPRRLVVIIEQTG